ncbi:dihydrofolate reductase family protein [Spongiactinospora sp. TRM90649]|uniref:dihydrofolate reductase family protein n=1 Tax=Spongiactinospora sp. TRM90649 TaxID=3031114 RepID=UPI0023F9742F|nr:dihydrofolate reductase family protein [Spongiactinospora sp. TRM90649]MDF5751386.1 dihydrofolate reductase family protein [Spongiactinospora sp. TRM90649]
MRKIVNATYMSLDGDISNMQDWHFEYFDEDAERAANEQLFASDALIMGRETYDGFSTVWSERGDADEFSARMNEIPKYVVSSSLKDPSWNNTHVISEDVASRIRELKERPGANILQYGFGSVTRLMLDNGLLDELRLWIHPVISGKASAEELLYRDAPKTKFTLAGTDVHKSGIIILRYEAIKPE